jgi:hypothetical protein
MDHGLIKFPAVRPDGTAQVDVYLTAAGVAPDSLVEALSIQLSAIWNDASPFKVFEFNFDPAKDLMGPPVVAASPDGGVLTLMLKDGRARIWKDWFILHVVPQLTAKLPTLAVSRFASPADAAA